MQTSCEKRIPVITLIDVEPDLRLVERVNPAPWEGYEKTHDLFSSLRVQLAERTGHDVHYAWFYRMDPQIEETYGSAAWAVENYPQIIEDILWQGDDVGLHAHAWRWCPDSRNWITDHGNQVWINHCMHLSFETFFKSFGRPCGIFRFGDRWMNQATLELAEKLGAVCDLTIEPGQPETSGMIPGEAVTGRFPDYTRAPRGIYQPSPGDFLKTGALREDGLVVMPLSTGLVSYKYGRLERLYRHFTRPELLQPFCATLKWDMPPAHFRSVLDQVLTREGTRYVTLLMRSDASRDLLQSARLAENSETLLSYAESHPFVFMHPLEALASLGFSRQVEILL